MSRVVCGPLEADSKVILYRSQPIAEIRNGSISNSRSSSNSNLNEESLSGNNLAAQLLRKMTEESMLNQQAGDSGNYSLTDSFEKLSSPTDSNDAAATNNAKNKYYDLSVFRTSLQDQQNYKKARKVKFFRNGDKTFAGQLIAISPDKYKNMAALMKELTRVLSTSVTLMDGVRAIYDLEGHVITEMDMLLEGESYVAASKEVFHYMDYENVAAMLTSWNSPNPKSKGGGGPKDPSLSSVMIEKCNIEDNRDFVRPRTITVVQNGNARALSRLLLNKKTAFSFEQVIRDINDSVKLNTGAVRKVYNLQGKQMTKLSDFFEEEDVFVACGPEKLKNITDEELAFINERVTIGSKSPMMGRRKSVGGKSPLLARKQPGTTSPKMVRRSIDMGQDFSPLKILDRVGNQEF